MSSTVSFPPPFPTLKLTRSTEKWAATLAEERRRLEEDQEALREREANLRDYEARLRAWQADIDAGRGNASAKPTPAPFAARATGHTTPPTEDVALQGAWEKLHRARELLEAELTHLRDDRLSMKEMVENMKRREQVVAEREAKLAEREALVTAALPEGKDQPAAGEHTFSAMTRLTLAPFEMARSVFGSKK
jgi:hypothetical protein